MEFLGKLRLRIGASILAKKTARLKRNVYYSDFQDVKSISIVWDASKINEFPGLSRFHQKMADKKIDLKILGYYPGKILPDQYTALKYLLVIRKEELNRFYQPVSTEATAFINTPWDILIDMNFEKNPPLSYITQLSKARLRVGLLQNTPEDSHFDLMLEMKKPVNTENYLDQVVHYLGQIKNNGEKAVKE